MEMASATSLAATLFFLRTILYDFIPSQLQEYLSNMLDSLFSRLTFKLNVTIHEFEGKFPGPMYKAAQTYLSTKLNPSVHCIRVSKKDDDCDSDELEVKISRGQQVVDIYKGIKFTWFSTFRKVLPTNPNFRHGDENDESVAAFEDKFLVLTFHKKYKDIALKSYLPFVLSRAKAIREESKTLRLYSNFYGSWECVNLRHPATFESMAMDSALKREVMEDLARFAKRKEYYKRVGKAWKRGYLLYGPAGTGKSSLIAAMANYLRYDIYDLELTQVSNNIELRALLVGTTNRSILVVEDIDCTVDVGPRENKSESRGKKDPNSESEKEKLTLSGLLNFADGLWSSCGDERIIVFTTNHKDKLDPALLRPGRMDMHIHMGYCTPTGFRALASNYHSLNDHQLFWEIEGLIEEVEIAPAEVAGELMRSDDAEVALQGLINALNRKKLEADEVLEEGEKEKVDG